MSFLNNLTAFLPIGKKKEKLEYFFAINIGLDKITAALWTVEGKELKILNTKSENYSSNEEIITIADKLLDQVIGLRKIEPSKVLFGVPGSWLANDNLKDEYLKILRVLVKELELTPMAYVATSHAVTYFLEKIEGVPPTAILVGLEKEHLSVAVVRAGKIDGVKVISRGDSIGANIEKALLTFVDVETLPSKIFVYGLEAEELKSKLMAFSWMSRLSFLHFPKIEILDEDTPIKSICLAGGLELNENIVFTEHSLKKEISKKITLEEEEREAEAKEDKEGEKDKEEIEAKETKKESVEGGNFGFVVGDVATQVKSKLETSKDFSEDSFNDETLEEEAQTVEKKRTTEETEMMIPEDSLEVDYQKSPAASFQTTPKIKFNFKNTISRHFGKVTILIGVIGVLVLLAGAYLYLLKAQVKVFVEPKILEKEAQVVADPSQKTVDEEGKIIPGQVVSVEISGSAKDTATGKKQIGDPAKGTVIIRNKIDGGIALSKGTVFTSTNGLKYSLDLSVNVASRSADDGTWGKATSTVTASAIGADGNLPSGTDFVIAGYANDKLVAKSEGNFAGGTSKDVTVVSSEDTQKLLAKLSSDLRKQAQQKLQEKYPDKKILEEALSENIQRKSYNKNINDQASEFSLNMTIQFKGTAFNDADLKIIVSKLVTTQVPDGFRLDLSETETQADVSKLEKDGRLIFLAKFRAKLIPRIDSEIIKKQIKFKTPAEVENLLKNTENVLGVEIKMIPNLPTFLQRIPILSKNIAIEVGLK